MSSTIIAPTLNIQPVQKTTTVDPMTLLLQNQMTTFVANMTSAGTLDEAGNAAALAQVAEMMSTISIPAAAKRTRVKKAIDPENQCMARTWSNGDGTQCKYSKKDGCGDYCSRCSNWFRFLATNRTF
mgnify:FL=1